jgi:hypothetical protein
LQGAALCAAFAGCGGPEDEAEGGPGTFIAFARDFADYKTWTRYEIPGAPAVGQVHLAGSRTVYINRLPPPDARAFPVGTAIAKEMESGEIFARAKRGGDYNKSGAAGWEWFDLKNDPAGIVIVWRGIAPPAGICSYGPVVGGVCNDCHGAAPANDFVLSGALRLGTAP